MKKLTQKQTLIQLSMTLEEMEKHRDLQDIANNIRASLLLELDFLEQNGERVGRDDRADIDHVITVTKDRIRWLEDHPDFKGNLIELRVEMGDQPSQVTLRSAEESLEERDTWPGEPPSFPPDSEPISSVRPSVPPKDSA